MILAAEWNPRETGFCACRCLSPHQTNYSGVSGGGGTSETGVWDGAELRTAVLEEGIREPVRSALTPQSHCTNEGGTSSLF